MPLISVSLHACMLAAPVPGAGSRGCRAVKLGQSPPHSVGCTVTQLQRLQHPSPTTARHQLTGGGQRPFTEGAPMPVTTRPSRNPMCFPGDKQHSTVPTTNGTVFKI